MDQRGRLGTGTLVMQRVAVPKPASGRRQGSELTKGRCCCDEAYQMPSHIPQSLHQSFDRLFPDGIKRADFPSRPSNSPCFTQLRLCLLGLVDGSSARVLHGNTPSTQARFWCVISSDSRPRSPASLFRMFFPSFHACHIFLDIGSLHQHRRT